MRGKATRAGQRIIVKRGMIAEPIPAEEFEIAEQILARLIAVAYTTDHPQLFGPPVRQKGRATIQDADSVTREGFDRH